MQDIVERVFLHLPDTVARNFVTAVVQQVRHNLLLDGLTVFLRIDAIDNLLLQLHQFLTHGLILQQRHQFVHLVIIEIGGCHIA